MKLTNNSLFTRFDAFFAKFLARNGIDCLRYSLGIIFIWFGLLKLLPGASPAEELAGRTISLLTHNLFNPPYSLIFLAVLEAIIGLGLVTKFFLRLVLFCLVAHMLGTLSPLWLFPEVTFRSAPFVPTLEGQYIIKNLVLMSAALVVGATVRGGRIVPSAKAQK